jgi:hypothetical protein
MFNGLLPRLDSTLNGEQGCIERCVNASESSKKEKVMNRAYAYVQSESVLTFRLHKASPASAACVGCDSLP